MKNFPSYLMCQFGLVRIVGWRAPLCRYRLKPRVSGTTYHTTMQFGGSVVYVDLALINAGL
jgi:hypothetical protein